MSDKLTNEIKDYATHLPYSIVAIIFALVVLFLIHTIIAVIDQRVLSFDSIYTGIIIFFFIFVVAAIPLKNSMRFSRTLKNAFIIQDYQNPPQILTMEEAEFLVNTSDFENYKGIRNYFLRIKTPKGNPAVYVLSSKKKCYERVK
ncbi:MAG: hypothetical protein PHG05_02175 [Candidatus Nanoarchaeia archaeon]|nr:hypothetical protein [Candidatus Nanoarchaeia archaeon]